MGTTDEYDGWENRETWAVALHINNDQGWQEGVLEALRAVPAYGDATEIPARVAGNIIRQNVEETLEMLYEAACQSTYFGTSSQAAGAFTGVRDDIGSLYRVDWTELGRVFLSDLAELDES